ncbi:hypothetical protein RYA05_03350 [Pseudomonas syringae pv. actinidiae]|nr:hypothetical protein [Pseudomonas syringae pv. actinidiae]
MIRFNPRTGEFLRDSVSLTDDIVLSYTSNNFKLVDDSEQHFSLLSIKRMFKRYPSLMKLTDWTESFMEQAQNIEARIGILRDSKQPFGPSEIQCLELQRSTRINVSELTAKSVMLDNGFKLTHRDEQHVDANTSESFSGYSQEGQLSLSYTPIREIFYLPIRVLNDHVMITRDYANENRDDMDYSRHQRDEYSLNECSMSIQQMLMAIMMDVNLDDEEDRLDVIEMIKDRLDSALEISDGEPEEDESEK